MSPKRGLMGLIRNPGQKGEPVHLLDHVRRLPLKAFHGPLDTDEREVLAGWDQAPENRRTEEAQDHGGGISERSKKGEGRKKETP